MKILARVHLYPPDHCAGAERMLHEMLKALANRGHNVEVHLSRFSATSQPYELDGVQIWPRDTLSWTERARDADVLITHLDNTSTVIRVALALRKPLIQVLHNTHPATRMWASCYNSMLVYNSEWMRDILGNDPSGMVVHPPVFVEDYAVERPLDGHSITLVNLNQAKGGVIFSQLAAMLPAVNFLGVKGAYGEQLDPRLPNVKILEHGADMREVYAATRVLLMPSSYESWGRVGVEAMCSGIPVIATDTPGLREALEPDRAILVDPDADAREWKRILTALLNDPYVYWAMSDTGKVRARQLEEISREQLAKFCEAVEGL